MDRDKAVDLALWLLVGAVFVLTQWGLPKETVKAEGV